MLRRSVSFIVILIALAWPGAVVAGQPDTVDPALMQPPLNATFAPWTCFRTGGGIVCDGARTLTWENADYGISCDGRPIYGTGYESRTQRRFGDANGLALRTVMHFRGKDVISLQPDGSGPTINGSGMFKEDYHYLVAGDLSTRTDRYSGVDVRYNAPGYGLVFHDTGTKMFDIDDNVLMAHGQHPLLGDFEATFAKLCDVFEALGA